MSKKQLPLLVRLLLGIVIGVITGLVCSMAGFVFPVSVLATFNSLFGAFLSFIVPLLVLTFVTIGIADLGAGANKLLGLSVGAAYVSTTLFAGLAMLASRVILPKLSLQNQVFQDIIEDPSNFLVSPLFTIDMPPTLDVLSALVLAFILGVGLTHFNKQDNPLYHSVHIFQQIIELVINKIIIPLLPIHMLGVFANMSYSGQAMHVMRMMLVALLVIVIYHTTTLLIHFLIAGTVTKKNPFKLLLIMLPAYVTAFGTRSSAASIPVSRRQMKLAGVTPSVANFIAPLFSAIHMPGGAISVSTIGFVLAAMSGIEIPFGSAVYLIMMVGVVMIAAPGVPGGAILAAIGLLQSNLGFTEILITLAIAMDFVLDPFGTACNVTSDGALALEIDTFAKKRNWIGTLASEE